MITLTTRNTYELTHPLTGDIDHIPTDSPCGRAITRLVSMANEINAAFPEMAIPDSDVMRQIGIIVWA